MVIEFSCRGNAKQLQACEYWLDNETEQILYGGAKAGGKSYLGCSLIFGDAFLYPDTHYFIARKELTDLRKFTIPSILEVFASWGITQSQYRYNGQDNYFELDNGSKVYLIACTYLPSDQLFERFGSMQMTRGWIEEAGEISEDAKKNLWISIGRWKNDQYGLKKKMLITCNPKKGFLYREFYKPFLSGELPPNKKYIQALVYDNKSVSADYINSLDELTGVSRERLLKGNWDYDDSDNAIMDYDAINDAFTNSHVEVGRQKYITADIALEGSDLFVIGLWYGWVLIKVWFVKKSKPKEVVDFIQEKKTEYKVPNSNIVFDADGVGAYVGGWVVGAKSFHNGGAPIPQKGEKQNYENLKTQCEFYLATKINDRSIWLKALDEADDKLGKDSPKDMAIQELEQIKTVDNPRAKEGKLRLASKKERKANIGRSPDISDMIMMRSYFDIQPKTDLSMSGMSYDDL
jgi:phage terminase large subunit